jgi:hypothetical protein
MQPKIKDLYEKARFLIKIPFIVILVTLGFLFEFLISVPFMVLCELDQRFRKKA